MISKRWSGLYVYRGKQKEGPKRYEGSGAQTSPTTCYRPGYEVSCKKTHVLMVLPQVVVVFGGDQIKSLTNVLGGLTGS